MRCPTWGGFEESSVSSNLIHLHAFLLHQDVQSGAQGAEGGKQMGPDEVFNGEGCIRFSDEEGTTLGESCDVFAGDVAVGEQTAAVRIAIERQIQEGVVEHRRGDVRSQSLGGLAEQTDPGIVIRSAVVGMCHTHQFSVGCGDKIDFLMDLGGFFLHDEHGEDRGARRDIAGAHPDTVGGHHTGSASPSGGHSGMPASSPPEGSSNFAPSEVSLPAISPAKMILGRISESFQEWLFPDT
jgi:hypothetical protein